MLPGILLMTLSSLFLISPRAPMTTGIVFVFISHILLTSISKSLYLDNFSVNFAEVLLSDELICQWACTVFLSCLWPQCRVCWLLFPCRCAEAYPSILWPRSYRLLLLAGVHTTSQLYRFHNLCRSSNECMLLSCYANKCTLFSLIQGTPRQCDQ